MTRLRSSRIPINIIYFNSEHRSSSSPRPLRSCSLAYSKRCSTNSSDIITQNILDHFILTNSLHTVNNVRANKETNVYSCTGIAVTPASGRIRHSPLLYCWRCLVQELPVSCLQCKRVSPAKAQLGIHPSEVIIRNEKEQLALNTKQMEERMQELENESFQQMSQLEKWGKEYLQAPGLHVTSFVILGRNIYRLLVYM
ncbi:uncharacterized protein LOC111088721 [Limulus polyphemus]|uniref:Uncharacterized protein LOC111088721 n=1 Tax=Limulus polyphemus TaxID=6850 RepID=A0ABM1THC0_LIMPO|nr:uncharacterized protein LOC111088721 [Limulus polyphemus]